MNGLILQKGYVGLCCATAPSATTTTSNHPTQHINLNKHIYRLQPFVLEIFVYIRFFDIEGKLYNLQSAHFP